MRGRVQYRLAEKRIQARIAIVQEFAIINVVVFSPSVKVGVNQREFSHSYFGADLKSTQYLRRHADTFSFYYTPFSMSPKPFKIDLHTQLLIFAVCTGCDTQHSPREGNERSGS